MIHMNPKIVGIGTTVLVALIFTVVVVAPKYTNPESNLYSENHRPRTPLENQGRRLYMDLGCQYCHTQYI